MGLIDDDGIIGAQAGITLGFGQQDAVGHNLDIGILLRTFFKPNFIPDRFTGFLPQFFSDTAGNSRSGDPARLGASDEPIDTSAGRQAEFRQLGGLAGTGLTGNDNDLMIDYGLNDLFFFGKDRQIFIKSQFGQILQAPVSFFFRSFQPLLQAIESLLEFWF